ncbi:hypothetical protein KBD13_03100 [Patescibacteria group bacterium]|nr:hypothetical protein [Patescibacteria group bacterium]MDQ5919372.1 hypothetical protein [Patescibacteria group bacterium]
MSKPLQSFALTIAGIYGVMRALQMAPTIAFSFLEGRAPEYASSVWGLGTLAAVVALFTLGLWLVWRHYASFYKEDLTKEILPLSIAVAGSLMVIDGISSALSQAGVMIYLWQANSFVADDRALSIGMGIFGFAAYLFRVMMGVVFLMGAEFISRRLRKA